MYGIAGLVDWGDFHAIERMTAVQAHRGPDDSGVWDERLSDGTWWGLGSRRLAIQDLTPAGHMPMVDASGRVRIVYNGDIYNAPTLRRELESDGVRFHSSSASTASLPSRSPTTAPRLMLVRDHFGVKPQYFMRRGDSLAFASEAKALFELPDFHPTLDRAALRSYRTFLWVPEPRTLLWEGVEKLPA